MENLKIRSATFEDIDKILKIYSHYVLNPIATFDKVAPSDLDIRRRMQNITNSSTIYRFRG